MRSLLLVFAICISVFAAPGFSIPPPAGTTLSSSSYSKSKNATWTTSMAMTSSPVITASTTIKASSSSTCQSVAPTFTPPGTTSDCCEYYTIAAGDTCTNIEDGFGITLAFFQSLNTAVNDGCTNL